MALDTYQEDNGQLYPPDEPQPTQAPATTAPASTSPWTKEQVQKWYTQYLPKHGGFTDADYFAWAGNANAEEGIKNSPEAQANAQGQDYTRTYTPMQGWDTTKLNSGTAGTNKYKAGQMIQAFFGGQLQRGQLQSFVDLFNRQYGTQAKVVSDDTVDFGDGNGNIDLINGNNNAVQWTPTGSSMGANGSPASPYSGAGGSYLAGSGGAGSGGDITAEIARIMQGFGMQNPGMKASIDAYRNEQTRAQQRSQGALAERAAYQGLPSGFVDSGIQSGIEQAGTNTANFAANMTAQDYEKRRGEMMQLYQTLVALGESQAARALQSQIAQWDHEYRYDNLAFNIGDREAYWNQQALEMAMGQ